MLVIEKAINHLLNEKPFYAHFFLNSKIVYDVPGVPTAGAGVLKDSILLCFNRKFIESLTPANVGAIIEHEVLHVLFEHIYVMKDNKGLYDKHITDLAMDLAINQYIKDLPDGGMTLEVAEKMLKQKLEPEQTWEYYYSKLITQAEKFSSQTTIDIHDANLSDDVEGNMGKEVIKATIDAAIKNAKGNVPNVVLKSYDAFKRDHQMPWKQILNNFVSRCIDTTNIPTRKKRNRRFGLDQPGYKKKRELTLGVCVDSSGSISDEQYTTFMNELTGIVRHCKTVYFVEADCEVHSVETIKKNKEFKADRNGCGGTAYQPAIDKCKELKCDAIVYFGDMDSADKPIDPKIPFMWAIVGGSPKAGDFGYELRLS